MHTLRSLSALLALASATAMAQTPPAPVVSPATDRTALRLTVYSDNLALIEEIRRVSLPAGVSRLALDGMPATLQPESVQLDPPAGLRLLSQAYLNDVASPQTLLEHSVGKTLTLELAGPNGTTRTVSAKLLSAQGPIWQIGSEIVTGLVPQAIRLPALPGELVLQPTLLWTLESSQAGSHTLPFSYLASGLSWRADYALRLTADGTRAELLGWATITNQTETRFPQAQVALVAGQPHRPVPGPAPLMRAQAMAAAQALPSEALAEYHLYRLPTPVSLLPHSALQIALLEAHDVAVQPAYVVEGASSWFRMSIPAGQPQPQPVRYYLSFANQASAGLGLPLPAGTVRVFAPDRHGQLQWLGEDRLEHTPSGETVRLLVGNAFDLVAERTQTEFQRLGEHLYESAFAITLRNHKSQPVTIEVREPVGANGQVLESNYPPRRLDAFTLSFTVPVPANGSATLRYRVRTTD